MGGAKDSHVGLDGMVLLYSTRVSPGASSPPNPFFTFESHQWREAEL